MLRDKNIAQKNLENINTSQYMMESIIDDIVNLIDDVEQSSEKVKKIIDDFSIIIKRDGIIISTIKNKTNMDAKLREERKILNKEKMNGFKNFISKKMLMNYDDHVEGSLNNSQKNKNNLKMIDNDSEKLQNLNVDEAVEDSQNVGQNLELNNLLMDVFYQKDKSQNRDEIPQIRQRRIFKKLYEKK